MRIEPHLNSRAKDNTVDCCSIDAVRRVLDDVARWQSGVAGSEMLVLKSTGEPGGCPTTPSATSPLTPAPTSIQGDRSDGGDAAPPAPRLVAGHELTGRLPDHSERHEPVFNLAALAYREFDQVIAFGQGREIEISADDGTG
jgi:hypothetical protein